MLLFITSDIELHDYVFGDSYIVQCKSSVDVCISTKIQWLLFMKTCYKHVDKYLCTVLIAYVCC
jgi:hypothetical protein